VDFVCAPRGGKIDHAQYQDSDLEFLGEFAADRAPAVSG